MCAAIFFDPSSHYTHHGGRQRAIGHQAWEVSCSKSLTPCSFLLLLHTVANVVPQLYRRLGKSRYYSRCLLENPDPRACKNLNLRYWSVAALSNLRTGSQTQKGITTYALSANRQRPLAGTANAAVFNSWRRFKAQALYVIPPFAIAYMTMNWAIEK